MKGTLNVWLWELLLRIKNKKDQQLLRMMMMFLSSPPVKTTEYLGSVSNRSGNLGRFVATIFVQTIVEK
jgi:hypothetical protein